MFYDFEVFRYDWLVVINDTNTRSTTVIHNDCDAFKEFYDKNKNDVWVGFNSNHFDKYVIYAVLSKLAASTIHAFAMGIINGAMSAYKLMQRYKISDRYQLYTYDTMPAGKLHSLKQIEGFMGSNIEECSVPFNIQRQLSYEELQSVIAYCIHDVEQTMLVFMHTKSNFDAMMMLIKTFKLDLSSIGKSEAQLAAVILDAKRTPYDDEFDITIIDTLDIVKYKKVVDWYRVTKDYDEKLTVVVAGIDHVFGWGGIHGAIKNYFAEGVYIMSDITSMHPALIIEYDFLSRSVTNKEKYRKIRDNRVEMKRIKNNSQIAYKLVLNATNGAAKDPYNALYDPRQNNNVCVTAQLVLLDLIEHCEHMCKLIQSNTDGILIKLSDMSYYDEYMAICAEWEQRTRLQLEHDVYRKVIQKDVNNYLIMPMDPKSKCKSKGAYAKELSPIDYNLAIVNEAVIKYFADGVPVSETINNCTDYIKFQNIVKVSSLFSGAMHNNQKYDNKIFRVYASKSMSDGTLYKLKGGKPQKVGDVPTKCYIDNSEVLNKRIPRKLDRNYYIDLANDRIQKFIGVKDVNQISLFD